MHPVLVTSTAAPLHTPHLLTACGLVLGLTAVGCHGCDDSPRATDAGDARPPVDAAGDTGAAPENTLAACMDGRDNDTDGRSDCDDPDCAAFCGPASCTVSDGLDGTPGPCEVRAPPNSFEPDIQWAWSGEGEDVLSVVIPLVANLSDDNSDGAIDLCDVPDVVVIASPGIQGTLLAPGHVYVLDGATGAMIRRFEHPVSPVVHPALGDLDDDGIPEIVAYTLDDELICFEHDGTVKWTTPAIGGSSVALADMDNDGDVEISYGPAIFDHRGEVVVAMALASYGGLATFADMDGDGDLELVMSGGIVETDGTVSVTFEVAGLYPHVADFDLDGLPEVLITGVDGIHMFEHDGARIFGPLVPSGAPMEWGRPAAVHNMDADAAPEFVVANAHQLHVFSADGSEEWSAPIVDESGAAGATAFDFLGDGSAEAMYADEESLYVFGAMGDVLLETPRTSVTLTEYPVVADIDNDGSAEILVVSNHLITDPSVRSAPTLQAIRDVDDRWIQARRIWNQHTYHVTNVREDGTVPQFEAPAWEALNTFRTNAQIEGDRVCVPDLI